jgi:protease-4
VQTNSSSSGRLPKQEGGRHSCLITFVVIFIIIVVLGGGLTALAIYLMDKDGFGLGGDAIAVIDIKGAIYSSEKINRDLDRYRRSERVKAIILRVDSPGGAVAPTQEIYKEIQRTKQEKNVIVSMGSMAASGGLYVAAPAHKILANPATITGSIGVIMQTMNIEELYGKIGLSTEVIKSGKFKDIGSATRPMKEEERELLQQIIDEMYQQFLDDLSKGRGIDKEKLLPVADGRIFTGTKAKELGLVDEIGNFEDAIEAAKKLTGIEGRPDLIYPKEENSWWVDLLGGKGALNVLPQLPRNPVSFQYLYVPGI